MSNVPTLTYKQRMDALVKAAEIRSARARLRKQIAEGEVSFAEALCDPVAARMPVMQLVRSVKGFGKARTEETMKACGIHESRRCGGLGPKQRAKLLEAMAQ